MNSRSKRYANEEIINNSSLYPSANVNVPRYILRIAYLKKLDLDNISKTF